MSSTLRPAVDFQACLDSGWQTTPDLGPRLFVLAGLMLVLGWVLAQRRFAGQRALALGHVAMVLWLVGSSLEQLAVAPDCKASTGLLVFAAILSLPPLWALFLFQYAHDDQRPPRGAALIAWASVLLLTGLAWTNGWHGLWYGDATHPFTTAGGAHRLRYDRGPAFFLALGFANAVLVVCTAIIVRALWAAQGAERAQWRGFLVMALAPWVTNLLYLFGGVTLFGVDPTPLSFAVSVAAFAWLIGTSELFKMVPLARGLLFSELPDPVLIVDSQGRVMDANEAAQALAGDTPPRGLPLADWPGFGAALAQHLARPTSDGPALVTLAPRGEPERLFEVRTRTIGKAARTFGRLVQLRDVTEQQQAQARIVQALDERNAQLRHVATLQAELREQALRDPLTGLYNRRALEQRFEQEAVHALAVGQPLSLVLIDIDHFKRINDTQGHGAGDEVLRRVAALMQADVRASDTVFRVGGEEFALLLPGADAAQAAALTESLRRRLAESGHGVRVTFSAGIAELHPQRSALDDILRAADRALYAAKDGGRNRSELATPP